MRKLNANLYEQWRWNMSTSSSLLVHLFLWYHSNHIISNPKFLRKQTKIKKCSIKYCLKYNSSRFDIFVSRYIFSLLQEHDNSNRKDFTTNLISLYPPQTRKRYFDIKTSRFFWYPTPWKWDWWFIVRQEIGAHGCKCFDLCKLFFLNKWNCCNSIFLFKKRRILNRNWVVIRIMDTISKFRYFFKTISPISFVFMRLIRLIAIVIVCK